MVILLTNNIFIQFAQDYLVKMNTSDTEDGIKDFITGFPRWKIEKKEEDGDTYLELTTPDGLIKEVASSVLAWNFAKFYQMRILPSEAVKVTPAAAQAAALFSQHIDPHLSLQPGGGVRLVWREGGNSLLAEFDSVGKRTRLEVTS